MNVGPLSTFNLPLLRLRCDLGRMNHLDPSHHNLPPFFGSTPVRTGMAHRDARCHH
jgi:hypothetical protein